MISPRFVVQVIGRRCLAVHMIERRCLAVHIIEGLCLVTANLRRIGRRGTGMSSRPGRLTSSTRSSLSNNRRTPTRGTYNRRTHGTSHRNTLLTLDALADAGRECHLARGLRQVRPDRHFPIIEGLCRAVQMIEGLYRVVHMIEGLMLQSIERRCLLWVRSQTRDGNVISPGAFDKFDQIVTFKH